MAERASGGARAVDRKHAARDAARKRNPKWLADRKKRLASIGKPPIGKAEHAYGWLSDVAMRLVEDALSDPGLTPEQQREQAGRLVATAGKVVDPARMAQKLAELETALEEARAVSEPKSKDSAAHPGASIQ